MLKVSVILGLVAVAAAQIQPNFPSFPIFAPATDRPNGPTQRLPPMEPMAPNFPVFPPVNAPNRIPTPRPPNFVTTGTPTDQNVWPPVFPTNPPVVQQTTESSVRPSVVHTSTARSTTDINFRPPTVPTKGPVNPTFRPLPNLTFPPAQPTIRPPNNINGNSNNFITKPIKSPWGTARYDSRCPMGFSQYAAYIPDSTNCRKFYMCNYGIAWLMSCPPSVTGRVIWSQEDGACKEVEDPRC